MSYIYIQSEPTCWTVGFSDADGVWNTESDHSTPEKAAERVAYLNGGGDALELRGAIQQLKERVTMLEMSNIDLRTAVFFAPQATAELTSEPDPMLAALQSIAAELKRQNDRLDRLDDREDALRGDSAPIRLSPETVRTGAPQSAHAPRTCNPIRMTRGRRYRVRRTNMATRRVTCRFCGRRVRVGVTGRIYRHNAPSGARCITGSWVKAPPPEDEFLTPANMQKWRDMNAKTGV